MKAKTLAAIDKIAATRGISRQRVMACLAQHVDDERIAEERTRAERVTREAEARTPRPYDGVAELRQLQADGERLLREIEERQAPPATVKFLYADGSQAEWTHDTLAGVQQMLADELRSGMSDDPERDTQALADGNALAREHGLPEVHA